MPISFLDIRQHCIERNTVNTILIVTADTHFKNKVFRAIQKKLNTEPAFTESFEDAIRILSQKTCSVVVGDSELYSNTLNIQFFRQIKQLWPKTMRILLIGDNKNVDIIEIINHAEIFRVFEKKSQALELVDMIIESIETFSSTFYAHKMSKLLRMENSQLNMENHLLEQRLSTQVKDTEQINSTLSTTLISSVKALSEAVEAKDPLTHGHSERVAIISKEMASALGLSGDETAYIEIAALLHDIGKIGISESILNKPSMLTQVEMAIMQQHPIIGYNIVTHLPFDTYIANTVLQHHENFDGSGYPHHLTGHAITLGARIIHLADAYDTMTTVRPYHTPLEHAFALEEIKRKAGCHFDPELVALFIELKY